MARAWQTSAPEERLGTARPGGLLTAAAAVPLGVAVVLAAGLLPGAARVALGVALVVVGVGVRGLVGTAAGARVGDAVARAVGAALVGAGVLAAAGGLAVAIGGGLAEERVDVAEYEEDGDPAARYVGVTAFRVADAVPAAAFGLLVVGAVVLLVRGRVAWRGPLSGSPAARSVAAVLAGIGGAVVLLAVTGDGALGLGVGVRGSVLLAVAAVAAVVVVAAGPGAAADRGREGPAPGASAGREGARPAPGASAGREGSGPASRAGRELSVRAAGVGAGVLLAVLFGEASDVVASLDGGVLGVVGDPPTSPLVMGAQLAVVTATAGALLAAALMRRDPLLGALPVAVLLTPHGVEGIDEAIVGMFLVPVVAALLLVPAAVGRGPLSARVAADVARSALAVVVVVLLVAVSSATGAGGSVFVLRGYGDVDDGQLVWTILTAVVLVAGVVLVARGRSSAARGAAAVAIVLGFWELHPLWSLASSAPEAWYASVLAQAAELLVELALVGVLVAVVRGPWVLAAGALVLADVAGHLGGLTGGPPFSQADVDIALSTVRDTGPSVVLVLLAGVVAVTGPPRLVAGAQRAGAVFVPVAVAAVLSTASTIVSLAARWYTTDDPTAPMDDGSLLPLVALLLVLLLGAALLAASTARRPSGPVAAAAALAAIGGALFAAALGAGRTVRPADPGPSSGVSLTDAVLGFRATASPLQDAGGGWPLLFGVLAAVLLAAAWWLESRRPAPPGAPVG